MATLLEYHAKNLLRDAGFTVPVGAIVSSGTDIEHAAANVPGPPWIVKAQVATTGRAALGGVVSAATVPDLHAHVDRLLGAGLDGLRCPAVLVEEAVEVHHEWFVAALVDPWGAGIRVTCSPEGGSGIEERLATGGHSYAFSLDHPPLAVDLMRAWGWSESDDHAPAVAEYVRRTYELLASRDLLLVEINPVGVTTTGELVALDAHVTTDDAAAFRQPWVADHEADLAVVAEGRAWRRRWGGDFKVLDPDGEVGVLNTGAGVGMLLIDELARRGVTCFNFSDIRAGTPRLRSERLQAATDDVLAAGSLRVVIVNIHAGVTDLGEILPDLRVMVQAASRRAPVILRLEGRGSSEAADALRPLDRVAIATSLQDAIDTAAEACRPAA